MDSLKDVILFVKRLRNCPRGLLKMLKAIKKNSEKDIMDFAYYEHLRQQELRRGEPGGFFEGRGQLRLLFPFREEFILQWRQSRREEATMARVARVAGQLITIN